MNSLEPDLQPDRNISIKIQSSVRNQFVARVILVTILSVVFGIFYANIATKNYQKGSQLTQEKYLKNFDRYKSSLMNDSAPQHPAASIFVSLIVISFLIGSYELAALAISLIIGKVFKS